jgi:hypothetical protein
VRRRKKQDQKDFAIAGFESAPFRIIALAVNVGGGGYNVGDEFLIAGGTFSIQGRGYVVSEVAGAVTEVAIQIAGAYTVSPGVGAATVAQTGGGDNALTVDVTLSALFDFGSAAPSAAFPNALTLPANVRIQAEVLAASGAIPAGDTLFDDTVNQARNSEDLANLTTIRAVFGEGRSLTITRGPAISSGTLQVYFFGPKGQRILVGTGTLT